jgi:NAD binding domain of 6-phosphogluconate dehydrogenase
MATIGFAGLGHMGTPIAGRLAAAGYRLRVFDIAPAARARHEGIEGVAVVSQVAEIADGADVVILMLPDLAVVAQVLLDDGLLEHVASSAVVVDMSSSVPARTRDLARTAAERGRRPASRHRSPRRPWPPGPRRPRTCRRPPTIPRSPGGWPPELTSAGSHGRPYRSSAAVQGRCYIPTTAARSGAGSQPVMVVPRPG